MIKDHISTITLLDPFIGSKNIGDQIIHDYISERLFDMFPDSMRVALPTHSKLTKSEFSMVRDNELCFLCGTNLIGSDMRNVKQWNIDMFDRKLFGNSVICFGVGWWQYQDAPNTYTKILLDKILSRKYLHSVRDHYTEEKFCELGFDNVINTACPTTWDLTPEHCAAIPREKRDCAVFTITDYARDPELIQRMLEIIRKHYSELYFFQQGTKDMQYLQETTSLSGIRVIQPTLAAYDALLKEKHPDFIGTRLHGGIRALQHSCRALIVGIDNRALELSKDINLPVITMNEPDNLEHALTDGWEIALRIPSENIRKWKEQFESPKQVMQSSPEYAKQE